MWSSDDGRAASDPVLRLLLSRTGHRRPRASPVVGLAGGLAGPLRAVGDCRTRCPAGSDRHASGGALPLREQSPRLPGRRRAGLALSRRLRGQERSGPLGPHRAAVPGFRDDLRGSRAPPRRAPHENAHRRCAAGRSGGRRVSGIGRHAGAHRAALSRLAARCPCATRRASGLCHAVLLDSRRRAGGLHVRVLLGQHEIHCPSLEPPAHPHRDGDGQVRAEAARAGAQATLGRSAARRGSFTARADGGSPSRTLAGGSRRAPRSDPASDRPARIHGHVSVDRPLPEVVPPRENALLRGLTDAQVAWVESRLTPRQFGDGQHVFRQGDPGQEIFLICSGKVEVYWERDGQTFVLAQLEAGDYFGEMALIDAAPRSASVRAVADAQLATITRHELGTADDLPGGPIWPALLMGHAHQQNRRLLRTNEDTVAALRREIATAHLHRRLALVLTLIVALVAAYAFL